VKILFIVQAIDYIDSVGIMLVSALAKKEGHTTRLGILGREDILAKIRRDKPDIIAYSGSTGEHKYYLDANRRIKAEFPGIYTIMGGPHVTFYPKTVEESTLDAVCVGEGDEAWPEFLRAFEKGGDLTGIDNIVTRRGGNGNIRPFYEDLDKLPFPDRELFYETTEMGAWPLKSFMASRGCPYNCTYCFNHVYHKMYEGKGKLIRRHSVDYVIEEVARVKAQYPLHVVKFYDDIFSYRADDWLEEFTRKYKAKIGLPFHCLTRANLMTDDMARLLKEAGCYSLSMSIEAGNEHFCNDVLNRGMSTEEILRGFLICHKHGIYTFSNNILGLPHATLANEIETIDLNLKAKVSFAEFPIFHPYPRTALGDKCIEEGIYNQDYSGLHMSYMNKSPLTCFTEKEKNIQRNLSTLGLLVIWQPWLRGLVLKYLIHLPYNALYFWLYYFAKVYLNKTRVYPIKLGPLAIWRIYRKSSKLEKFKKFDERKTEAAA
jgi:radical SAM superfamily enzyme YgiQ (UPF0313 family)